MQAAVDLIRSITEATLPNFGFMHGTSWDSASGTIRDERVKVGFVILDPLIKRPDRASSTVTYRVAISILKKDRSTSNEVEREQIVNEMDQAADTLMNALDNLTDWRVLNESRLRADRVKDVCSGIGLTFELIGMIESEC